MKIIITSPSLDVNQNISGISAITRFIITFNTQNSYLHFEVGKRDNERRNLVWLLKILKTYIKWAYVLLTQDDTLIHFNLALDKRSLIRDSPLILMARLLRKRMILHLHGGDLLIRERTPVWITYALKVNFAGNNPTIVLSELEREILRRKLTTDAVFVLPNCVGLAEAMAFNRTYQPDELLSLLFMGRISVNKGLEFIFEALELLTKRHIRFQFTMAGKGPDQDLYVRKFHDLLGDDFEFKGVVGGDQRIELLKNSNVFLLPSLFEGLPMALLESMSFGLVPITTHVGSIKVVVTNHCNGIIVKTHSSTEIARALERLASDKQYMEALSRNARDYMFKNYDPALYIRRLNKIYDYE